MIFLVLMIFLLPLSLAGTLILKGVRGVRIGNHPVCRRCGFDLFGKSPDTKICGECGAQLTMPESVVIGHRRRRPTLIAGGLAILLPVLFLAGAMVWEQINAVDWRHFMPVSWLVTSASSANPAVRTPALAELISRLTTGQLTASQMTGVVEAALAYQGDLSKPWDTGWGDLLELGQARGQLTHEQWARYASQTWPSARRIRVRPQVRLGDPLICWLDVAPARTSATNDWLIRVQGLHIRWPGVTEVKPKYQTFSGTRLGWGASTMGMSASYGYDLPADRFPPGLQPGPITVHFVATAIVGPPNADASEPIPLVTGKLDLPATFTLLPGDRPDVAIVRDPSLAGAIQKSLAIDSVRTGQPTDFKMLDVKVNGPPVGLAFDVILESGTTECKLGFFACPAGKANWSDGVNGFTSMPLGNTVDVVLRSNPADALNTTDTFQAWDGEIVFKDVPVQ